MELLAHAKGYEVVRPPNFNRELFQGRLVRSLIAEGGKWNELVPVEVAEYIKSIGGEDRLRLLASTENVVFKL